MRMIFSCAAVFILVGFVGGGFSPAGDGSLSWTMAPKEGRYLGINLGVYSLGKYLAECQVNRPEILNEVKSNLREGGYYRKRTRDQKNRPTTLTVYVDPSYMLHIVTHRNDTCPDCNGTGTRAAPFDKFTARLEVRFACLRCKGEGEIKDNQTERYFLLSSEDFENREEGREVMRSRNYAEATRGAEQWVERLASRNPGERLEACLWLDDNYVRAGVFFQDIMPMLKKARYYDTNDKRKIMVWQFWAGKDLPGEEDRAYYRIYADSRTGKITEKGFYPER
jgi:hypothetical protein